MKRFLFMPAVVLAFFACDTKPQADEGSADTLATETEASVTNETSSDWIQLLDEAHANGWRAYNGEALPPGWTVKDGVLSFDTQLGLEQDYKGGIDIIYGAEEFENFDLYLEWKLPKGGNSGIFYHLPEGHDGPTGISPEYQLIDDVNYAAMHDLVEYNTSLGYENPSQLHPLQKTGSDYAMYPADDSQKVLSPIEDWNSSRIVFTPEKVEYWLNDKLMLSFVPWSEDWKERKSIGKWKDSPLYGSFKKGHIGLQDHSSPIWFRNIKIKKL